MILSGYSQEKKMQLNKQKKERNMVVNMSKERARKNLEVARMHFNNLKNEFVKSVRKRCFNPEEINEVLDKMDNAKELIAKYERLAM